MAPAVKGSPEKDKKLAELSKLMKEVTGDGLKNGSRKVLREVCRRSGHLFVESLFHALIKGEQSTGGQTGADRAKRGKNKGKGKDNRADA